MTRATSTRAGTLVRNWWPSVLAGLLFAEWAANWWPGSSVRAVSGIGPAWLFDSGDFDGHFRAFLHPLFYPHVLVLTLAGIGLARRWLPLEKAARLPWTAGVAFVLYLLVQAADVLFLLGVPATGSFVPLSIAAILFKVFGIGAVGAQLARPGAAAAWADTQPQGAVLVRRRAWGWAMLVACAAGLFPLLSVWDHLAGIVVVLPQWQVLEFLGRPVTALLLAAWVLRMLDRRGVLRPQPTPGLARAACWVLAGYLLLAPAGMVLSAIPYGGGSVPPAVRLLLPIVQLLGLLGLVLAIRRSAPAAPALARA
jgi:hypothetical protein